VICVTGLSFVGYFSVGGDICFMECLSVKMVQRCDPHAVRLVVRHRHYKNTTAESLES